MMSDQLRRHARVAIRTGASGFALLLAMPAIAQTGRQAVPNATLTDKAPVEVAATSDPSDVVVTARRREERIQDVPLSISSLSGDALKESAVTTTTQLTQLTPGLNFTSQGATGLPNIRGVGTTNAFNGDEPNVALYVDGIYQPDAFANIFTLPNIQRIEVLKGPQGTLFGRNATGGAINVIMRQPSRTTSAEGSIGYGRFDELLADAYVTTPITDQIAGDLTVAYARDDGYVRDIANNRDLAQRRSLNVRGKLLFDVGDSTTITVGGIYGHDYNISGLSGQSINGNTIARARGLPFPTEPYQTTLSYKPNNVFDTLQGYVRIGSLLGSFPFSSQTSVTSTLYKVLVDSDYTTLDLATSDSRTRTNTLQQEFLLNSSPDSSISWVGGLFLYHESSGYSPRISNRVTVINDEMTSTSVAGFGEVTIPIITNFSVTGGLRYTWEARGFHGSINNGPVRVGGKDFTRLTPRVVAQYVIPHAVNLYASYSEGFKSGVFNTTAVPVTPVPVQPEILKAFEIGAKTLFDGPIRASLSAYHYDYSNIQVSVFQPPSSTVLFNAAAAKIYGAEANLNFKVVNDLELRGFATYTHARYTDFNNAIIYVPLVIGGNQQVNNVNVSGNPTVRTPTWTAGAGATVTHGAFGGNVRLNADLYYNGGFSWEFSNRLRQAPYALLNGSISWTPDGSAYTLTVWGQNLTNQIYSQSSNASAFADVRVYAKPITFGGRLSAKFR